MNFGLPAWMRQPTIVLAFGIFAAAVAYWFTGSAAIAMVTITTVLGAVSDNTKDLLAKIEALEDALKKAKAALAFIIVCGLLALSACSAQQQQLGCQIDQTFQPIAATTLSTLLPQTTPGVTIDNLLVHPAVVQYCQSLGGSPAAAAATP